MYSSHDVALFSPLNCFRAVNLTLCPRTVNEIENVIAGGNWPPLVDEAPDLKRNWCRLADDCQSMTTITIA